VRQKGYIVPLLAVLAGGAVAAVLASGGSLSGARPPALPSGASPACLPRTLAHSALLAGTPLAVSPAPNTNTADQHTQISLLGAPAADVAAVSVQGARSGSHSGRLRAYSQDDGASFIPDRPFRAGERVRVRVALAGRAGGRTVTYGFRVATPYPVDRVPSFPNPPAAPSSYQSFASAPALHPPLLQVTTPDRDAGAGDVLMTVGPGQGQYGPVIYNSSGRLVWFSPAPKGQLAENLSVQRFGGQRDLTWWQGKVLLLGFGQGVDVIADHSYHIVATVHAGNGYSADLHDFQLAQHQIAYVTVYSPMRCDLSSLGGARNGALMDGVVQAIDVRTGLVRWEWHSLDHVSVSESHAPPPASVQVPWDWFHMNSVDPQQGGDVLISGRTTWASYDVQGASGRILWQLGGSHSSFVMGPGTETAWQHDARLHHDGSVTLFDNGSSPRVHSQSRAMRMVIDYARHSARLARAYPHPGSPLAADSQGDAQTLPDGNLVVGWGAIPSVTEVTPGGRLLFDAHLPPGASSYRAFRYRWSGTPAWPPAVSARVLPPGGDSTAVFASWNGATGVAFWRVLAGDDASSLRARATTPASGFESSVTFPDAYRFVAVQALDAAGRVLASSATVRVQPAPPAVKAG
jgi:hypothetical protein